MECLRGYAFPGNIRELRNILERAALLADGRSSGRAPSGCLPPDGCRGQRPLRRTTAARWHADAGGGRAGLSAPVVAASRATARRSPGTRSQRADAVPEAARAGFRPTVGAVGRSSGADLAPGGGSRPLASTRWRRARRTWEDVGAWMPPPSLQGCIDGVSDQVLRSAAERTRCASGSGRWVAPGPRPDR